MFLYGSVTRSPIIQCGVREPGLAVSRSVVPGAVQHYLYYFRTLSKNQKNQKYFFLKGNKVSDEFSRYLEVSSGSGSLP
jgi:hypothetical protein